MNTPVHTLHPNRPYKQLPQNVEAEQALLGALLVNNEAFHAVSEVLAPQHFSEPLHRQIFEVIGQLIRANKKATPVTLKTFLPADVVPGQLTMPQYLFRLVSAATTVFNAPDFAAAIRDAATRRALIGLFEDGSKSAFDMPADQDPQQIIEDTEARLYQLAEKARFGGGFNTFSQALATAQDTWAEAYQREGHLAGLSTGLASLDARLGGLQRSDLIVLAGRPAMGKTALATNIAFAVARDFATETQPDGTAKTVNGGVVGFFSLEMSADQLATRIVAAESGQSSSRIRRGEISERDFERLVDVSATLQRLPLYIDATGAISLAQLAARARRLKRQHGLDLLIIDYIQLMAGRGVTSQNRVNEITEITTGLKALAKELDVPIIALSQLSRAVENRENKRPQLSDLRESGSIEQDADVVMFVYREEYYLANKEPEITSPDHAAWQAKLQAARGKAEAIVAKHRHAATGTATLAFSGELTRFDDLATDDHLPERFE